MWMWQSNAAHNYRSGFLLSLTAAAHATVVHVSSSFHLTGKKTGQTGGGGLHFNKSLYSRGPSSKYEAHRNPNHLRITGLMAFSAPVACKILNIRCVFKKKKD